MISKRKRKKLMWRKHDRKLAKIHMRKLGKTGRDSRAVAYNRGHIMNVLGYAKQFKKLVGIDKM